MWKFWSEGSLVALMNETRKLFVAFPPSYVNDQEPQNGLGNASPNGREQIEESLPCWYLCVAKVGLLSTLLIHHTVRNSGNKKND